MAKSLNPADISVVRPQGAGDGWFDDNDDDGLIGGDGVDYHGDDFWD